MTETRTGLEKGYFPGVIAAIEIGVQAIGRSRSWIKNQYK